MGRAAITIEGPQTRTKAALWVDKAPIGTVIEFRNGTRSIPQNSRMWPLLTAVSDQLVWHGKKYSTECWKDFFVHMWKGETWMPAEEGGMVPIGRGTSTLTKKEHAELTMVIEAFAARHGVDLRPDEEKEDEQEIRSRVEGQDA